MSVLSESSSKKEELSPFLRRLRAFTISNGTSILSVLPAILLANRKHGKTGIAKWWIACVFRLAFICSVLGFFAGRLRQSEADEHPTSEKEEKCPAKAPSTIEMILRLLTIASPLESLMSWYAIQTFVTEKNSWVKFLPMTFLFEVLMDFGHYVAHRAMHSNAFLYTMSGHKTHHAVLHPTVLATFNQDPLDVVFSNVLPVLGSLWIMSKLGLQFTKEQLLVAMGLKTYVEVAGHVGILDGHATSFPQFVWLPRILGMELHTKDHDLHHSHGGRHNFSKRFTLFDKLFGTYRQHSE